MHVIPLCTYRPHVRITDIHFLAYRYGKYDDKYGKKDDKYYKPEYKSEDKYYKPEDKYYKSDDKYYKVCVEKRIGRM